MVQAIEGKLPTLQTFISRDPQLQLLGPLIRAGLTSAAAEHCTHLWARFPSTGVSPPSSLSRTCLAAESLFSTSYFHLSSYCRTRSRLYFAEQDIAGKTSRNLAGVSCMLL